MEYAAPPGLKIILVWDTTNMSRLTALGMAGGKDPAKGGLGWANGTKCG